MIRRALIWYSSSVWRLQVQHCRVLNRIIKWGNVLDGRLYTNKHEQTRSLTVLYLHNIVYIIYAGSIILKIRSAFQNNPEGKRTLYIRYLP